MIGSSEKRSQDSDEIDQKIKVVIIDIEGTTTSISFVKDTLFPYIRENLQVFLKTHWKEAEIADDVILLRKQAESDKENGVEGFVPIPTETEGDELREAVCKNILWQMDLDRKTKALKQLQGHVMKEGYVNGKLKGHVYDDVQPALKSWTHSGREVYVYSSGSVAAQKLLFGFSEKGDLLEFLSGHFDTDMGPKVEASSYDKISKQLKCKKEEIMFLTDVPKEAIAARDAGLHAVLVSRPGNAPLSDDDFGKFRVIKSFEDIVFEASAKRTKLSADEAKSHSNEKEVKSDDAMEVDENVEGKVSESKGTNVEVENEKDQKDKNDSKQNESKSEEKENLQEMSADSTTKKDSTECESKESDKKIDVSSKGKVSGDATVDGLKEDTIEASESEKSKDVMESNTASDEKISKKSDEVKDVKGESLLRSDNGTGSSSNLADKHKSGEPTENTATPADKKEATLTSDEKSAVSERTEESDAKVKSGAEEKAAESVSDKTDKTPNDKEAAVCASLERAESAVDVKSTKSSIPEKTATSTADEKTANPSNAKSTESTGGNMNKEESAESSLKDKAKESDKKMTVESESDNTLVESSADKVVPASTEDEKSKTSTSNKKTDESTSTEKTIESSSAEKTDKSTSSEKTAESTSSEKTAESTSSEKTTESTSSEKTTESNSTEKTTESNSTKKAEESTSAEKTIESTSPKKTDESTRAEKTDESTNAEKTEKSTSMKKNEAAEETGDVKMEESASDKKTAESSMETSSTCDGKSNGEVCKEIEMKSTESELSGKMSEGEKAEKSDISTNGKHSETLVEAEPQSDAQSEKVSDKVEKDEEMIVDNQELKESEDKDTGSEEKASKAKKDTESDVNGERKEEEKESVTANGVGKSEEMEAEEKTGKSDAKDGEEAMDTGNENAQNEGPMDVDGTKKESKCENGNAEASSKANGVSEVPDSDSKSPAKDGKVNSEDIKVKKIADESMEVSVTES